MFLAKSCFCFRAELLRPTEFSVTRFQYRSSINPTVIMEELGSSTGATTTNSNQQQRPPQNPYQGPEAGGVLPPNHFIHKAKRVIYIILSGYGLHHFKFFKTLLKSPNIRHEWFQIGLATTVGTLQTRLRVYPTASLRLSSLTNEVYDIGPLYLLTQVFLNCQQHTHQRF